MMHQAVVVEDALLEEQLVRDLAELPPWRDVADGLAPLNPGDEIDAFVEHRLLLGRRHGNRIFVRIAMNSDLMTGLGHGLHLFGKGFDRVAGDKPGGLEAVALEEPQEPRRSHFTGEHAARYIAGRVFPAIGAQPARHRIHVHAIGNEDLLRH